MPEIYRDLLTCVKCDQKGGSIKKCAKCFSVSYCGRECQVADWARHKRLCDPVMIKDFGEKGRGLVASRDFKIGDLIMKDKAVVLSKITNEDLNKNEIGTFLCLGEEIRGQISQQTDEVKGDFLKLSPSIKILKLLDFLDKNKILPGPLKQAVAIFINNRIGGKMYLKLALINHSCDPNVDWWFIDENEGSAELRANKDIKMGEEITASYISSLDILIENKQQRQAKLNNWILDCKCPKCEGPEDASLDTWKKEIKSLLKPETRTPSSPAAVWKNLAKRQEKIVDAILTITKKPTAAFFYHFQVLASLGHLARNPRLVDKGMKLFKECVVNENVKRKDYENQEKKLNDWRKNFLSKKGPGQLEIIEVMPKGSMF